MANSINQKRFSFPKRYLTDRDFWESLLATTTPTDGGEYGINLPVFMKRMGLTVYEAEPEPILEQTIEHSETREEENNFLLQVRNV